MPTADAVLNGAAPAAWLKPSKKRAASRWRARPGAFRRISTGFGHCRRHVPAAAGVRRRLAV